MLIIYDGGCPFCTAYNRHVRLLKSAGHVELHNARDADPLIAHYRDAGYDLDEGILVVIDDHVYAGAEAIHVLALHTDGSDFFNRLHARIFSHAWLARWIYPLLKIGRRIVLFVMRKPLLKHHSCVEQ